MGKRKVSVADDNPSIKREHSWQMTFKTLVALVRDQQRQIESVAIERKTLEKRIQSMHERWVFNVKQLEDQIDQVSPKFPRFMFSIYTHV